jgi:hypothetical protein
MKNLASLFLVMLAVGFLVVPSRAGDETDKNLTKEISVILTDCKKIVPGTTRAELLEVFITEGGISQPAHRILVHRRCPYIKIEVDFTLSDPKQKDERLTDTVSKVSKPYLEWSIID